MRAGEERSGLASPGGAAPWGRGRARTSPVLRHAVWQAGRATSVWRYLPPWCGGERGPL